MTTKTKTRSEELGHKLRALHAQREPLVVEKAELDGLRRAAYRGDRIGSADEENRAAALRDRIAELDGEIAATGSALREVRGVEDAEAAEAKRPEVAKHARAVVLAAEKLEEAVRRLDAVAEGQRQRVGPLGLVWPSAHGLALTTFKSHAKRLGLL